jgi:Na+-transporting NADH:ubiquinone oxidoreductase subunit A
MADSIKIKKGLNINLMGESIRELSTYSPADYALKPTDFIGIFPRLLVKEGDHVNAGSPVFHEKFREELLFTIPGKRNYTGNKRGEKRVLEAVIIRADGEQSYEDFGKEEMVSLTPGTNHRKIIEERDLPLNRQRPYNVIANPMDTTKAIFVSGFGLGSAGTDVSFAMSDDITSFRMGMGVFWSGLPQGKSIWATGR